MWRSNYSTVTYRIQKVLHYATNKPQGKKNKAKHDTLSTHLVEKKKKKRSIGQFRVGSSTMMTEHVRNVSSKLSEKCEVDGADKIRKKSEYERLRVSFMFRKLKTSLTANTASCDKFTSVSEPHFGLRMTSCFLFPILAGPKEAAMGGADREGPGQAPRLLLCPAGRAGHRGLSHADRSTVRLAHAPGQLHQPPGGTNRHGPHLGQDAQLQRGRVREGHVYFACVAFHIITFLFQTILTTE